ncbi:mitochondrial enolase superfamily member 1 [Grus japonensis]|uniref:Mitochondrial enolase superfamily member 1 n=1 Tax=Grus japonensis TaxID=30415 RepID=A0ABC9X9Y3_GRUJA
MGKSISMSLLYWGAQNWTQLSRCGLTSAEQMERITSLNLLAMLCLIQPRIPLDCRLCHRDTLLAHVQLAIHQDPQILCSKVAFQLVSHHHVLMPGVVPPQVQDFAFVLVELHEVPVGSFLQPLEVALDGSMILWFINDTCQCCVISKIAEGALCPIVQIIREDEY